MASYFDSSSGSPDSELLPRQLHDHEDLIAAAASAEADVIAHYTFTTASGPSFRADVYAPGGVPSGAVEIAEDLYVGLRGYAVDAAAAEANLAAALKAEIAAVIRWRIAQWAKKPLAAVDYAYPKFQNFRPDAEHRFPPGFGSRLAIFDVRPTPLAY